MTSDLGKQIHSTIRWVPDFPQDGIHFADLTPVLVDPTIFNGIMPVSYTHLTLPTKA